VTYTQWRVIFFVVVFWGVVGSMAYEDAKDEERRLCNYAVEVGTIPPPYCGEDDGRDNTRGARQETRSAVTE